MNATTQQLKDAPTTNHRYANGVRLPSSCKFCNSENMTASAGWTRVNQHSHDGEYVTVIKCRDCGGAMVQHERGNKRVTTMDDRTLTETRWEIPHGFALVVCPACGVIIEARDADDADDRAFVQALRETPMDERPQPACHDVGAVVVQGTYRRAGDGTPLEDPR